MYRFANGSPNGPTYLTSYGQGVTANKDYKIEIPKGRNYFLNCNLLNTNIENPTGAVRMGRLAFAETAATNEHFAFVPVGIARTFTAFKGAFQEHFIVFSYNSAPAGGDSNEQIFIYEHTGSSDVHINSDLTTFTTGIRGHDFIYDTTDFSIIGQNGRTVSGVTGLQTLTSISLTFTYNLDQLDETNQIFEVLWVPYTDLGVATTYASEAVFFNAKTFEPGAVHYRRAVQTGVVRVGTIP
jgi:hypothetical protein